MCMSSLSESRPTAFWRSVKFIALQSPASVTGSPFGPRFPSPKPPFMKAKRKSTMIHQDPLPHPSPFSPRVTAAMSDRLMLSMSCLLI